jgi:hypothetical protein
MTQKSLSEHIKTAYHLLVGWSEESMNEYLAENGFGIVTASQKKEKEDVEKLAEEAAGCITDLRIELNIRLNDEAVDKQLYEVMMLIFKIADIAGYNAGTK